MKWLLVIWVVTQSGNIEERVYPAETQISCQNKIATARVTTPNVVMFCTEDREGR